MRVSPDAGRNEQSWNSPSGFGQLLPRIEAALAEEPTRYQSWVYGFTFCSDVWPGPGPFDYRPAPYPLSAGSISSSWARKSIIARTRDGTCRRVG